MVRDLWRKQRGSVSLISIMVIVSTLLLMTVLLDRDQVNYLMHAAEQDADFAAESATINGARQRTWMAKWHLRVNGTRYYIEKVPTCTKRRMVAPFDCLEAGPDEDVPKTKQDSVQNWVDDDRFRNDWKAAMGCWVKSGEQHVAGDFVCDDNTLQVRDWYIRYTPTVKGVAESVFSTNFAALHAAQIVSVKAEAFSGGRCPNTAYPEDVVDHSSDGVSPEKIRQVNVTAVIQVRSLFGRWVEVNRTVTGAALPLVPIPRFVKSVAPPPC